MNNCKICQAKTLPVIAFGKMPIANGFLKDANAPEYLFDLAVQFCPACFMVQLQDTVPPEKMFHDQYHFLSSTSRAMEAHFAENAKEILDRVKNKPDPFIVELGCNDGIMLKHIAAKNIRHLGVEPSGNVADVAAKNGVSVTKEFFHRATVQKILKESGPADVISGSNVFCHIESINSVFEGISVLLKEDGYVYFEDPYLFDIIKKSSFDQIYDEHVFYYSGLSVRELARRHGLELVDMAPQEVHGGSMRYYLKKMKTGTPSPRVDDFIAQEKKLGLDRLEGYLEFRDKVNVICHDLKSLLAELKKESIRVVGYGATSKSTTLLNYAEIGPELLECIYDVTPDKINKFTPGMHIPVKAFDGFYKKFPSHVLLLAWNHKKEILAKEKEYRAQGGKFITFFPKVTVE